jgi:ABC-2 type transport system permease protein
MFPVGGASGWIRWIMRANPLTYGMDALLQTIFPTTAPSALLPVWTSIGILAAFAALVFIAGLAIASRRTTLPAA